MKTTHRAALLAITLSMSFLSGCEGWSPPFSSASHSNCFEWNGKRWQWIDEKTGRAVPDSDICPGGSTPDHFDPDRATVDGVVAYHRNLDNGWSYDSNGKPVPGDDLFPAGATPDPADRTHARIRGASTVTYVRVPCEFFEPTERGGKPEERTEIGMNPGGGGNTELASAPGGAFGAGTWELTLAGDGRTDRKGFGNSDVALGFSLGYFATREIELNLRQAWEFSHTSHVGETEDSGYTQVAADWNFRMGKWVPFAGVSAGVDYGRGMRPIYNWAPEGGVKYFVNRTTFLYALVQYQIPVTGSTPTHAQWMSTIGIGVGLNASK